MRALGRVERRHAPTDHPRRHERAAVEAPVAAQRHAEDAAQRQRPTHGEDLVAREVAERVRDQVAAVPLHPAQHVGPAPDHDVGARVDDRVGERPRVAAVLAEEHLGAAAARACGRVPSAPACIVTMTTSALAAAFCDEPLRGRDVRQRLRPRVRREADERDLDVADLLVGDLTGRPVVARCCFASAASVCAWPDGPKSKAWLFARFITVKPAFFSHAA